MLLVEPDEFALRQLNDTLYLVGWTHRTRIRSPARPIWRSDRGWLSNCERHGIALNSGDSTGVGPGQWRSSTARTQNRYVRVLSATPRVRLRRPRSRDVPLVTAHWAVSSIGIGSASSIVR